MLICIILGDDDYILQGTMKSRGDTKTPETHGSNSMRRDVLAVVCKKRQSTSEQRLLGKLGRPELPARRSVQYEVKRLRWQERQDCGQSQVSMAQSFLSVVTTTLLIYIVTKCLHPLLGSITRMDLSGVFFFFFDKVRDLSKYNLATTL